MAEQSARYTTVAIILHWIIAAAIIFMIWLGWNMDENEARYQLHKSVGIAILLLTVARILWRGLNPPPPLPDDMKPLEKSASHTVHIGFYALMVLMPLSGWLLVSTAYQFDVPTVLFGMVSWPDIPGLGFLKNGPAHGTIEFVHSKLAWVAIAMLVLHVAGALKHEFSAEQGVLSRMLPGLIGTSAPPQSPARGYATAFGAAIALFALVAAPPALMGMFGGGSDTTDTTSGFEANWTVDADTSYIEFSGTHDGGPYSGRFSDWQADILFDESQLDAARASVTVATGSASASKKLYTDSLKAAEWLSVTDFPTAAVEITNFTKTAAGYTATATLTLKGITVEAPLDFTLSINGDSAVMDGKAVLLRKPLDLGQASDPGADWVSEEVLINVHVEASRQ